MTDNGKAWTTREYTAADLAKAYLRAVKKGPVAEARFRTAIDAAAELVKAGEPVTVAFFDLLAGETEGPLDA
ncbi:MAG: hypothetical protein ACYDH3_06445 [Candidatus Aminicenantales bacterium]